MKAPWKTITGSVVGLALVIGLATPAQAAEVTITDKQWSVSSATTDVKSVAQASAKTYLRYNVAAGLKIRSSEKSGCKVIKSGTFNKHDVSSKYKCYKLYTGVKFTNSGRDASGKTIYFTDVVGSKYSPGPWQKIVKRDGAYFKVGNSKGQGNCGNRVSVGTPPKLKHTGVVLTRTASTIKFKLKVEVKVTAKLSAYATATCTNSGSSATATASGAASTEIDIYVLAKTATQAKAKGKDAKVDIDSVSDAVATAKAKAELSMTAEVEAWCQDTPPEEQAPEVGVTKLNDVVVNATRPVEFTYVVPGTASATVSITAEYGTITNISSTTVSGSGKGTFTYKAPTEVPSDGHDTIKVTLNGSGGLKSATTTFVIKAQPVAVP